MPRKPFPRKELLLYRVKKKRVLTAFAALAAAAAFADGVSSSNIVGYMTPENDVAGGNKMMGAMFTDIGTQAAMPGTGSYSVQNITPTGTTVPNGETISTTGCISLRKLTASGGTDGSILYWRDGTFKSGKQTVTFHGWYADGVTTPADISLDAGQAVWLYVPAGADCSFTMSGEVPVGDVYMALNQNNTAVCNPQPSEMDIQDIEPYAAEGVTVPNGETISTTGCISLRKLTASGGTDGSILYWRDGTFKSGKQTVTFHGWYADGVTTPADVSLAPGEGLWVFSPTDGISLVFPSVLTGSGE